MKKILTVDDSRTIRRIIHALFVDYHCRVIEAVNGVDGFNKAETEKPDIILLDVSMPRMDGKQLLSKLQSHPQLFTIPVIMLTAEGDRKSIFEYLRMGACGFVVKPFERLYLQDKVIQMIHLQRKDAVTGQSLPEQIGTPEAEPPPHE